MSIKPKRTFLVHGAHMHDHKVVSDYGEAKKLCDALNAKEDDPVHHRHAVVYEVLPESLEALYPPEVYGKEMEA